MDTAHAALLISFVVLSLACIIYGVLAPNLSDSAHAIGQRIASVALGLIGAGVLVATLFAL